MKRLPGLGSNITHRDFLKISLAASAASVAYPALLTGCGTEETKKLYVMNTVQTQAHLKLVEFFSQKAIFGPPAGQELLDIVVHLYTPEEAEIVQYLPLIYGLTAIDTAQAANKPLEAAANYVPPPPTYLNMALQIAPNYAQHLKQFTGS